jgi:hypothetical protein
MTRFEAWLVHIANLLVGATGIAYAILRYAVEPPDPFAAVHPWLPPVQHAHVWTAPLLVFALGLVWRAHVTASRRLGIATRRRTGTTLMATAAPMIASGYLLQTAVDPTWRKTWLVLHLGTSALWLAATLLHQLLPRLTNGSKAVQP